MIAIGLFAAICAALLIGFPVAFTLAGVSLLFALIMSALGHFDLSLLNALPNRIFGITTNATLIAVPLFVFMGVALEQSQIAQRLLKSLTAQMGNRKNGLGIAVMLVGVLMAASTGIVGATVVTMGLIALPAMLQRGYSVPLATGTVCAAGTLGQIIPPSIVLVLLGDVLANAYQQAQLKMGIFSPETVSIGELFVAAIIPGLMLVGLYLIWILIAARKLPQQPVNDAAPEAVREGLGILVAPLALIVAVLGSIMLGIATPTEAAGVGALGALLLARLFSTFDGKALRMVMRRTVLITGMVFMILIGASVFSLVFRGLGGDALVHEWLTNLPGGVIGAMLVVMVLMFLLGFVLDFIEITFVVVPIVGPVLLAMGLDPVWMGIMIAINLQTSFLTPPFGFALFYLRGVAPKQVRTQDIYKGVAPFIGIQLLVLGLLAIWPELATWLPEQLYAEG